MSIIFYDLNELNGEMKEKTGKAMGMVERYKTLYSTELSESNL
jgi:hypothetical protein